MDHYHHHHHQSGGSDPEGGGPAVTLTVRLIMQGKVGYIDNWTVCVVQSGARINISDGTSTERLVTVTGSTEAVLKAFALIASKFEEVRPTAGDPAPPALSGAKPPVTLRLVVPDSQCGSLIGKGGAKIKEIREVTGASVQVASEMLPNSTERTVTISGSAEAISKCIYQICCVMLESPPKGPTIPYRPKPSMPPVIFAGGQAYTVQGSYAIPHPDITQIPWLLELHHYKVSPVIADGGAAVWQLTKLHQLALQHSPLVAPQSEAAAGVCLAAAASPLQHVVTTTTTTEMTIPNDLIGSVIGKGGTKINEIRRWPLALFYALLDITALNSYIIFNYQIDKKDQKERSTFIVDLGRSLIDEHLATRNLNSLPLELQTTIKKFKNNDGSSTSRGSTMPQESDTPKRCYKCPSKNAGKVKTLCSVCQLSAAVTSQYQDLQLRGRFQGPCGDHHRQPRGHKHSAVLDKLQVGGVPAARRPAAASGGLCSMEVCKPTTTTLLDPTAVPLSQLVPLPSSSRHLTTKLRTTPSSSSSSTAKKSSAAAATDRNNKFSPY
ncbi:PCBP3 [Cordylochernes scorpioides]|uniref:PCBP3 n=1 Tax=Cordylochernes scorpioides TaxID=51811 RepID=A0ABY6K1H4_9ARAC|nr:PCBP3 [Cordylochernes scorpioides]